MRTRTRCLIGGLALLLLLGVPGIAQEASEETQSHGAESEDGQHQGAHEGDEHEVDTWLGVPRVVWVTGNLIIFWGFLFYVAGPPIRRLLQERADNISAALARAAQQEKDASEVEETLREKIEALKQEMEEIVARTEHESEREREEILQQAEFEKERLISQAKSEIENRTAQARAELQQQAAQLATRLARQKLSAELTAQDRHRLFDENLDRLSKGGAS